MSNQEIKTPAINENSSTMSAINNVESIYTQHELDVEEEFQGGNAILTATLDHWLNSKM